MPDSHHCARMEERSICVSLPYLMKVRICSLGPRLPATYRPETRRGPCSRNPPLKLPPTCVPVRRWREPERRRPYFQIALAEKLCIARPATKLDCHPLRGHWSGERRFPYLSA